MRSIVVQLRVVSCAPCQRSSIPPGAPLRPAIVLVTLNASASSNRKVAVSPRVFVRGISEGGTNGASVKDTRRSVTSSPNG